MPTLAWYPLPSPWMLTSPSHRAPKVAKAAAGNSSGSPVKELRDRSAMEAFRCRSISVSEHAVRRLDLQGHKRTVTASTLVSSSMGWLTGRRVIVMWICCGGPLVWVVHAGGKFSSTLFGSLVLFYIYFSTSTQTSNI